MQLGAIFMDQAVFNVELPKADAEVIPGVPWGAMEAFPTPAYWAYQVYARRLTGDRINYKLGATLKEEVGACLLGCLLYTSPSPRDGLLSRMPSSA